jgi:hypothetical protein
MRVKQLSVFLENKSGSLVEVTAALNEEGVKLIATIVTDTTEFGVLRMIVDDPEKGQKILRDQGFSCRISDVVVLVADDNGGIVSVLKKLSEEALNVEYLYTFARGHRERHGWRFDATIPKRHWKQSGTCRGFRPGRDPNKGYT